MKTIYVKPWNGCNLRCDFCYNAQMENSTKMTDVVLERTLEYIRELSKNPNNHPLLVHLHGGEPMLYREDWLLDFCKTVRSFGCILTCTTNLTYSLTKGKKEILSLMTPRFGKPFFQTSYDVGTTRFKTETDRRQFFDNLNDLQRDGFNIQTTFCVTNELVDSFEGMEKLFSIFGNFINFERLTLNGNLLKHQSLIPSFEKIDEFFLRVWGEYVECKRTNPSCHVAILDDLVFSVLNPYRWVGCRNRTCSDDVLTIEPDGSIGTCPNVSYKTVGYLAEIPIEFVDKKNDLIREERQQKLACLTCDVFSVCHGDCYQIQSQDKERCCGLPRTIRAMQKTLGENPEIKSLFEEGVIA